MGSAFNKSYSGESPVSEHFLSHPDEFIRIIRLFKRIDQRHIPAEAALTAHRLAMFETILEIEKTHGLFIPDGVPVHHTGNLAGYRFSFPSFTCSSEPPADP